MSFIAQKEDTIDHMQEALKLSGLCTLCGSCMTHCPTYRETLLESNSPRGRITLVRAVARGELPLIDALDAIDGCLGCRACEPPCPAGVKWGSILEHFRAATGPVAPRPRLRRRLRHWALRFILGTPRGLRVGASMFRLYQRSGLRRLAHRLGLVRKIVGAGAELDLVLPEAVTRRQRARMPDATTRTHGDGKTSGRSPPRIAFFTGCIQDIALSHVNDAALRVLRAAGCEVVIPQGQACCGAVHAHAGEYELAVMQAKRNIAAAAHTDADHVVIAAGGCAVMMKAYPELFSGAGQAELAEAARLFSAKVCDFTEIAAQLELPAMGGVDKVVTYQDSCLMHNVSNIVDQPRRLLKAVPGIHFVELAEANSCCGAGGTYNITNPDMSRRILARKMEKIKQTEASIVCTANVPCYMQLLMGVQRSGLGDRLQVRHVAEILDEAITSAATLNSLSK